MDVVSLCPLQVAPLRWKPLASSHALTVVVKATYVLVQGEAVLSEVQEFPNDGDNHWNDDPHRSLYSPNDMVPFKTQADVVVVGDAFAPAEQPARSVVARLIVGSLDKSLEVFCDRHFDQDGTLVVGKRFRRMSLRYERAAKGGDNPVGIDPEGDCDAYGRRTIPNLQPPGLNVTEPSDYVESIGLGPIAERWEKRRQLLGSSADAWFASDWTRQPLPDSLDESFFNCAPTDQRLDELRRNERIVLESLHPNTKRLVCQLPGHRPRAFVQRRDAIREMALHADTLWIDTARGICTVTWRGREELSAPAESGRVYVALQEPGELLTWARVSKLAKSLKLEPINDEITAEPHTEQAPKALQRATSTMDLDEHTAVGMPKPVLAPLPFVATDSNAANEKPPRKRRARGTTSQIAAVALPGDRSPSWLKSADKRSTRAEDLDTPPRTEGIPRSPAAGEADAAPDGTTVNAGSASPWIGGSRSRGAAVAPVVDKPREPITPEPITPEPITSEPIAQKPIAASPAARAIAPNPIAEAKEASRSTPPPAIGADEAPRAKSVSYAAASEIVELLWFDEESMPRLREHEQWRELLAELNEDDQEHAIDFDEEPPPEEPEEVRTRREVALIMTRARVSGEPAIRQHMRDAVDDSGSFEPPLVLVSGRLAFPFDRVEQLKAMITSVQPFVGANKALSDEVERVQELLEAPWLKSSGEVTDGLIERVRKAFRQGSHAVGASYPDDQSERVLLEQRQYQRRTVFGAEWLRATMTPPLSKEEVPTYLPDKLANELPMFQAFDARAIAEAHVQQDQYESHEVALKVVAFGRVVRFRNR